MGRIQIAGAISEAQASRVHATCADALAALGAQLVILGADVDLEVRVVEADDTACLAPPRSSTGQWAIGWADRAAGVYLRCEALGLGDRELGWLVGEEVAHWWFARVHSVDPSPFHDELFAVWVVCDRLGADWEPGDLDPTDSYSLGRAAGAAIAGGAAARAAIDQLEPGMRAIVLDAVGRLQGISEPHAFARAVGDARRRPPGAQPRAGGGERGRAPDAPPSAKALR